jgi:hypothetical protein
MRFEGKILSQNMILVQPKTKKMTCLVRVNLKTVQILLDLKQEDTAVNKLTDALNDLIRCYLGGSDSNMMK